MAQNHIPLVGAVAGSRGRNHGFNQLDFTKYLRFESLDGSSMGSFRHRLHGCYRALRDFKVSDYWRSQSELARVQALDWTASSVMLASILIPIAMQPFEPSVNPVLLGSTAGLVTYSSTRRLHRRAVKLTRLHRFRLTLDELFEQKQESFTLFPEYAPAQMPTSLVGRRLLAALRLYKFESDYLGLTKGLTVERYRFVLKGELGYQDLMLRQQDLQTVLGSSAPPVIFADGANEQYAIDCPRLQEERQFVSILDHLPNTPGIWSGENKYSLTLPVGVTQEGKLITVALDDDSPPHIICSGGTRSGKTTWKQAAIQWLCDQYDPIAYQMYIIDLKRVAFSESEFAFDNLAMPIAKSEAAAVRVLQVIESELNARQNTFGSYDSLHKFNQANPNAKLPRIILYIDDPADLDISPKIKKQSHALISRLSRVGGAFGIHIIAGPQRPDFQVIPLQFRDNAKIRLMFQCSSINNAELITGRSFKSDPTLINALYLMGKGDFLYYDTGDPVRLQGLKPCTRAEIVAHRLRVRQLQQPPSDELLDPVQPPPVPPSPLVNGSAPVITLTAPIRQEGGEGKEEKEEEGEGVGVEVVKAIGRNGDSKGVMSAVAVMRERVEGRGKGKSVVSVSNGVKPVVIVAQKDVSNGKGEPSEAVLSALFSKYAEWKMQDGIKAAQSRERQAWISAEYSDGKRSGRKYSNALNLWKKAIDANLDTWALSLHSDYSIDSQTIAFIITGCTIKQLQSNPTLNAEYKTNLKRVRDLLGLISDE